MISAGFEHKIDETKIVIVAKYGSAPIRRLVTDAKARGDVIDCTEGRKTLSVIVMDNKMLVLSRLQTERVQERIDKTRR